MILLAGVLLGGVAVYSQPARDQGGANGTLAELEGAIARAGADVSPDLWLTYAQRLRAAGQSGSAVLFYKKVLEARPDDRAARTGLALALAGANEEVELLAMLRDMVYGEPKLALEIFASAECRDYLKQDRFAALQHEARVQAMD